MNFEDVKLLSNVDQPWWQKEELFEYAKSALIGVRVMRIKTGEIGIVFDAFIQPPKELAATKFRPAMSVPPRILLSVNFENGGKGYSRITQICHFKLINLRGDRLCYVPNAE